MLFEFFSAFFFSFFLEPLPPNDSEDEINAQTLRNDPSDGGDKKDRKSGRWDEMRAYKRIRV